MRQNMKRVTQAMVLVSLGLVMGVGFQNCGSYQALDNPLYDQASQSVCIGLACGMDTSLIKLTISNDTISVAATAAMPAMCDGNDSRCVDVGGYCDTGGFPNNQIYASISGGTVGLAESPTGALCIDGRYSVKIRLPDGYDYANLHTLRLTLYGFDNASANRYTNEIGANRRDVLITSYQ